MMPARDDGPVNLTPFAELAACDEPPLDELARHGFAGDREQPGEAFGAELRSLRARLD
jgi:hypothetical protein